MFVQRIYWTVFDSKTPHLVDWLCSVRLVAAYKSASVDCRRSANYNVLISVLKCKMSVRCFALSLVRGESILKLDLSTLNTPEHYNALASLDRGRFN